METLNKRLVSAGLGTASLTIMVGEPATYVQVLRTKGRRDRLVRFSNSPITRVKRQLLTGAYRGHGLGELAVADASQIAVDKNKEAAGGVSCMLWILTGIYYFATTPQAHFISWQGLVFFVGGGFLSALVLGAATHYLIEAHRKYLYRPRTLGRGVSAHDLFSAGVNIALNILQLAAPVVAARYASLWLLGVE